VAESHSPYLHHHFDSLEQQRQASSLGMWVFIAQEIMFFGGLFLGYTYYRNLYSEAFVAGSHMLSIGWGGFNTVVLIGSSLTVALAVRSAQLGRKRGIIGFLIATLVLGSVFLGVQYIEYSSKWDHHLVPGAHFQFDPHHAGEAAAAVETAVKPGQVEIFYSFYFAMTGMHALHMIIGFGILAVMIVMSLQKQFTPRGYAGVENFGLYWHFVDIVWVFLFPLFYLIH